MIAIGGFSRFPVFFSSDAKSHLGFSSRLTSFDAFVSTLSGAFVAIQALEDIQFKSRFVVGGRAINPELKSEENVPKTVYVFPSDEGDAIITDALSLGFVVKGARQPIFVPLLCNRVLDKKEANALLKVSEVRDFGLKKAEAFLRELGARCESKQLADGNFVLTVSDPRVDDRYQLLADARGRVLDVDFCVHDYEGYYVAEMAMFAREGGHIHHIGGFHY